jgi:hypothetical protein
VKLNDDDIAVLDARAAGTPAELNAFLDEVCAEDSLPGLHDGAHTGVLVYRPALFREHLNSQLVGMLLHVLDKGEVMDRVLACLRLLRLPQSYFPSGEEGDELMMKARRHLSELLVEHPVLMHNRIFVNGRHFAVGGEYGPIASVIAHTPRGEFPRLSHGIALDKLRAFARHHCVRTGLTAVAPSAPGKDGKYKQLQGKTLLGSLSPNLHLPRPGLLTSILELDEHRAANFAATRRPASFLTCRGQTENHLRTCVANSLLAAFNISPLLPTEDSSRPFNGTQYDPAALLKALASSAMVREPWFLHSVEANLYRWVSLPVNQVASAFKGLAVALAELKPAGLAGADNEAAPPDMKDVVRWLVKATLDSSTERAALVGLPFKNFPSAGGEKAVAFIGALEQLAPEMAGHDGELRKLIEETLSDRLGEVPDMWRASLRVVHMQSVMRQIEPEPSNVHGAAQNAAGPASAMPAVRRHRMV